MSSKESRWFVAFVVVLISAISLYTYPASFIVIVVFGLVTAIVKLLIDLLLDL